MQKDNTARLALVTKVARASRRPLPAYLFLRNGIYYFKRKVPRAFATAFPQAGGRDGLEVSRY